MEVSDEVTIVLRRESRTESEYYYRTPKRRDEPRRNSRRDGRGNSRDEWTPVSSERRTRSSAPGPKIREVYFEEERRGRVRAEERRMERTPRRAVRTSGEQRSAERRERSYREEKDYYKQSLKERSYRRPEEEGFYRERRRYRDDAEITRDRRYRIPEEPVQPAKKKKKGKAKKVFRTILIILLILIIGLGVIWMVPSYRSAAVKAVLKSPFGPVIGRMIIGDSYEKYVRDKEFDESKVVIHDGAATPDGNITIALFGVDARAEDLTIGTMADSMVVVNVDKEGNIKMASVFRDTYLMSRSQDGEEIISKANSAYFRGGPTGAINMLNENWDLAITDYVVVNFWGLANIIDLIGGIRLKVTEEEMNELNYHMYEQTVYGGTEYIPLETYGDDVLLTGDQATAFCRLRSVNFYSPEDGITYNDDYGRAARQRYTLTELIAQTRDKGVLKLMMIADELFKANSGERKFIQTSMDVNELIKLFVLGYDMNMSGSEGFPTLDHQYGAMLDSGASVVADTLEENVSLMHQFLYGVEGYEPTQGLREVAEKIRAEVARQIGY